MRASETKLPGKRLIVPIFLGRRGCPNRCVFCRAEAEEGPEAGLTRAGLEQALSRYLPAGHSGKKAYRQIAFYGGNFTGLDLPEQDELLTIAGSFVEEGRIDSLRISTRPDFLCSDRIEHLYRSYVRTVEIGAQSMADDVLDRSRRGHSAEDVRKAVASLKAQGMETGVHLMAGLPGDSPERFQYSVAEVIRLWPDMVRIHPTLVFAGTELAKSYARGEYRPITMDEAVDLCAYALEQFEKAGIPVIRMGLQPTADMERPGEIVAGPFHPAFRSLVEGSLFFAMACRLLRRLPAGPGRYEEMHLFVSPGDSSYLRGLNGRNTKKLTGLVHPARLAIRLDPQQAKGSLRLVAGDRHYITDRSSGVIRPDQLH